MSSKISEFGLGSRSVQRLMIVLSVAYFSPGQFVALAQQSPPPAVAPTQPQAVIPPQPQAESPPAEAPKIPNDQLDSLVAPIALYPDPLLAQTLAASTYPLEIIQLQQWMQKNKNLKGQALADAVAKQTWDPSVQSMAGIPDAVERLAGNIQWTTDLGNAFLAQQQDVMDAVQRMRAKAQSKGALKTSQQQTVATQKVQGEQEVIVIQQPNPEVVYVPSYDPAVVYGPPSYPYYPYTYPGYVPGMGLALGTGIVLGAAWRNNWGDCNWNNGGDININNNNNFNRNNISNANINRSNNKWQHNGQHRGGAPYSNRATAQKFGGTTRADMAAKRPSNVSQLPSNRQTSGLTDRSSASDRQRPSTSDRQRPAASDRGNAPSQRPQNRPSGNTDRISSREVSRSPSPRSNNAFSGPSSGMNRSSSFASSDRGSRSMSRSGGGFSGGGSRGGGSRGGGRRR